MNTALKTFRVFLFVLMPVSLARAEPRPAGVFTDNMVLQCGVAVPVWGTAGAGEDVSVSFAGQEKKATAGADGRWRLQLDPLDASETPRDLGLRFQASGLRFQFTNVLVGEVWLASGQSNMRFPLKQATGGAEETGRSADPGLRLLNLAGSLRAGVAASNYFSTGGWQICGPAGAGDFSAVAYFFGRKLRRELGVPVGLVLNAVGGAPVEAFLPERLRRADRDLGARTENWLENPAYPQWCRERAKQELAGLPKPGFHPFAPSALHDAGLAPIQPFAIRGVVWYQGESNATGTPDGPALDPAPYARMFRLLVADWRSAWNSPDLPVVFAQLPGLNRDWVPFREMQAQLAREIPNCGMAVTIDTGHPQDVHPPDKKPVGERLALCAMKIAYGMDVAASGPVVEMVRTQPPALQVIFKSTGGGLVSKTGEIVTGFQIAGANRKYFPATGRIVGETLRLACEDVKVPVTVRYAWEPNPVASLFGKNGLPAGPFRTDE